jgi:hypothetical protein
VDGLNQSEVRRQLGAKETYNKEYVSLTGQSGTTWGAVGANILDWVSIRLLNILWGFISFIYFLSVKWMMLHLNSNDFSQAMRSCPGSSKPIYISVGHRISLDSAIGVVKYCSKYRVPEPTRQVE